MNVTRIDIFKDISTIDSISWQTMCLDLSCENNVINHEDFFDEFINHIDIIDIVNGKKLGINFILKHFNKCPIGFIMYSDLTNEDITRLKSIYLDDSLYYLFASLMEI